MPLEPLSDRVYRVFRKSVVELFIIPCLVAEPLWPLSLEGLLGVCIASFINLRAAQPAVRWDSGTAFQP